MEIKDGGPAFPVADRDAAHAVGSAAVIGVTDAAERDRLYTEAYGRAVRGMTLRDKFAESALIGLLSEPIGECQSTASYMTRSLEGDQPGDLMARAAYLLADAMLRAREGQHDASAPDMLTALETVLAGGHLNTGEQAIVANAIAKATGRNVADVVKGE